MIELFWARNEDAIAQTDAAYGKKLFRLADRILNDPEDAEESVSDTYLKTWEAIPPQRPTHFYAFLAAICRNLSLHKVDWKRAAKRRAEVVSLTEEMQLCIPDIAQERQMQSRELGRILNTFLENLPRETRVIFLRRYWHMDTIEEIAQRYGITQSKVKMQLSRTRAKLRIFLEQEGISV